MEPFAYLKISERHELDNVPGGHVPSGRGQQFVVAVQKLHGAEVSPAHPHDDDGHGQAGGLHDRGAREIHVGDHTVRDDEQHVVLLQARAKKKKKKISFPIVGHIGAFFKNENGSAPYWGHVLPQSLSGEAGSVVDDGSEVGGTPELQLREALLVGLNHTLDPWNKAAAQAQHYWKAWKASEQPDAGFLTCTEGIGGVEVDRELVGHLEHIRSKEKRFILMLSSVDLCSFQC